MSRIKRPSKPKNRSPLPIIGKIKIGELTENAQGKTYPRSLDYFKATGKYAEKFHQEYGAEPSKIQIIFVSDDLDSVCSERYELRDRAGDLFGYGDGETFHIWSRKDEEYVEVSLEEHPNAKEKAVEKSGSQKGWEVVLTLRFILPRIKGVAGLWQLTTKGAASSVPNVVEAFDFVQEQAGTVMNMPFDLEVNMVKDQKPGSKSKFPVINLIPNVSKENMEVVREYLTSGHDVREIPKLLGEGNGNQAKALVGTVEDEDELEGTPFAENYEDH